MSNSLRDQLLKAGLVTQQQVDEASQPKPKVLPRQEHRQPSTKGKHDPKHAPRDGQSPQSASQKPPHRPASRPARPKPATPPLQNKDDLEQFYKAREQVERTERAEEERRQRELAARRKQTREQINTLIKDNLQNIAEAEVRYNFVVGENIKYLYVTETQQQALASGELAITFMEGKRCLIPLSVAQQILSLDPDKIIVINRPDMPEEPSLVVPDNAPDEHPSV